MLFPVSYGQIHLMVGRDAIPVKVFPLVSGSSIPGGSMRPTRPGYRVPVLLYKIPLLHLRGPPFPHHIILPPLLPPCPGAFFAA